MKNIILFDDDNWTNLLPLCYTRPISEIRIGILKIKEKWEKHLQAQASYITQDYLSNKFPIQIKEDNIIINATVLPNEKVVKLINQLKINEAILHHNELIAARLNRIQFDQLIENSPMEEINGIEVEKNEHFIDRILHPEDIFLLNQQELEKDFHLISKGRKTASPDSSNVLVNPDNIFIEEGAIMRQVTLNASDGPIYIGKDTEIMEGTVVRGGLALCEGSILKIGAKIYGATTIGPYCKFGGEMKNSVVFGYSNKSHEGFIGNSVLAEWCNLGADSNTSNLKNNYSEVKLWNYKSGSFRKTGQTFCGLIMGDHSKCGINTMFNTGTVVGISANIYGAGYPRNFVPSFAWGGPKGYNTYRLDKAIETSKMVVDRRDQPFTEADENILSYIYHDTSKYRAWEIN